MGSYLAFLGGQDAPTSKARRLIHRRGARLLTLMTSMTSRLTISRNVVLFKPRIIKHLQVETYLTSV